MNFSNGPPFEPIPIHRRSITTRRATTGGSMRRPSSETDHDHGHKKLSLAIDP